MSLPSASSFFGFTLTLLVSLPLRSAELHEGWPKIPGFPVNSSPALSDLNGDGKEDIIFGCSDGDIYAIDGGTGTDLEGWPVRTGSWVHSSPAVGDV